MSLWWHYIEGLNIVWQFDTYTFTKIIKTLAFTIDAILEWLNILIQFVFKIFLRKDFLIYVTQLFII